MRKTDKSNQTHYVTGRFFYTDDGWFSLAREKTLGPYPTKGLAVQATKNHIHQMMAIQTRSPSKGPVATTIRR